MYTLDYPEKILSSLPFIEKLGRKKKFYQFENWSVELLNFLSSSLKLGQNKLERYYAIYFMIDYFLLKSAQD